jgi:hypothetical protein
MQWLLIGNPMIRKIISGGQTGADRAALDVAIKLGIPHGGWIPKGRKAENGRLSDKYELKEMVTGSYPKRTEKNVVDSDGTLIISHGILTGGSALTRDCAEKHQRAWLHIDLDTTHAFKAALMINSWIMKNGIEILNVAGSRASEDHEIYKDTLKILESAYHLNIIHANTSDTVKALFSRDEQKDYPHYPPETIPMAVGRLLSKLTLKDRTTLANLTEEELILLHNTLGQYIRENFFWFWKGNPELINACREVTGEDCHNEDDACIIIIRELWKKLRETHKLRVVK